MSGKLVGLVMRGVHGISGNAKRVLIVLAEHCPAETSVVYPGVKRIAHFLGIGERAARDGLEEAKRVGWVRQQAGTGKGPGNKAKYSIDFAAMHLPAAEYDRSKGDVRVVAKAADAHRIKAADVRRNWDEGKRRSLNPKAADSSAKAADVRRINAGPVATGNGSTVLQTVLNLARGGTGEHLSVDSTNQSPEPIDNGMKINPVPPRANREGSSNFQTEPPARNALASTGNFHSIGSVISRLTSKGGQ